MTLTGVLCSTLLLVKCLHSYGTIIGIHIEYVFIARREVICLDCAPALSAFLYFKSASEYCHCSLFTFRQYSFNCFVLK